MKAHRIVVCALVGFALVGVGACSGSGSSDQPPADVGAGGDTGLAGAGGDTSASGAGGSVGGAGTGGAPGSKAGAGGIGANAGASGKGAGGSTGGSGGGLTDGGMDGPAEGGSAGHAGAAGGGGFPQHDASPFGGSAGSGDGGLMCTDAEKRCGAMCEGVNDPLFGCTKSGCTPCEVPHAKPGCTAGACVVATCDKGFAHCDGSSVGCETDTDNDPKHCGDCGTTCSFAHAAAACAAGACMLGACDAGYADCNGDPKDGCETFLAGDTSNCGKCAVKCPAAAGKSTTCTKGVCGTSNCMAPLANCSSDPNAACTTNLTTDGQNCGSCGQACVFSNAQAQCASSACELGQCNAGYANCDGNASNGCETNTTVSPTSCGKCGYSCPSGPHASPGCLTSVCFITCEQNFGDCDKIATNGCEVGTAADPQNCGGCANVCSNNHIASPTCSTGVCNGNCAPGFADCNGNKLTDGCEVDLSSAANCGACGNSCGQGQGCCGLSCATLASDPKNCGACGNSCSPQNVGAPVCASGGCSFDKCQPGFSDCDGNKANGCETNPSTDANNCGACGKVCGAGQHCAGGGCVCDATSCPNGCCSGGSCNNAQTLASCGIGGVACGSCDPVKADGCGAGSCKCGAGPACGAGQHCAGGACLCDGSSCAGCCNGNVCDAPSLSTCGAAGAACSICDPTLADTCASGGCHCGGGPSCQAGQRCAGGSCVCDSTSCASGCCQNNGCLPSTTASCGVKGDSCQVCDPVRTDSCTGGACECGGKAECQPGQHCLGGACVCDATSCGGGCCQGTTCEVETPNTCGIGGVSCFSCSTNNINPSCGSGACNGACKPSFGDCNNNKQLDGCEASLLTDNNNCGSCGKACGTTCLGNVTATGCGAGACKVTGCQGGYFDVNGLCADGCECASNGVGTCQSPIDLGATSVGAAAIQSAPTNVVASADRWFKVTFTGNGSQSYHPHVTFASNPGGEFQFDILSATTNCSQTMPLACGNEGGSSTGDTDWETLWPGTGGGYYNAIPAVGNGGEVFIRVFRKGGVALSCNTFVLNITN